MRLWIAPVEELADGTLEDIAPRQRIAMDVREDGHWHLDGSEALKFDVLEDREQRVIGAGFYTTAARGARVIFQSFKLMARVFQYDTILLYWDEESDDPLAFKVDDAFRMELEARIAAWRESRAMEMVT